MTSLPLTIEDQLILANLAYTHFENVVAPEECITLKEAAERLIRLPFSIQNFRVKNDYFLIEALVGAPRFSSLYISDVESHFDKGKRQFFSFTVHIGDTNLIAYRGTDNTVTGWKEDFDMAYEEEVPSQRDALKYLARIARKYDGKIILTGHSKGGNLALFAGSLASSRVQKRIVTVYNNDGPGFNEKSRAFSNIGKIRGKTVTLIPESSFIGMLMEHSDNYRIVASSNRMIMQHDPYSWLFDGPHFKYVESRSTDSVIFENVVSKWLKSASHEEREIFVDAAFKCIESVGLEDLAGNSLEILAKTPGLIRSFKNLSDNEKKVMRTVLRNLVSSAKGSIKK